MAKYENTKIDKDLLEKVKQIKTDTGITITAFVNKAVKKEIELYQNETKTKK